MRRIIGFALFFWFLLAVVIPIANGQIVPAPPPDPDPFESGWHITMAGGYSNLNNAPTNNGLVTSLGVRVAKHWNARIDYFTTNKPATKIVVGGPEYNFSLAHILKSSSFIDTSKLEFFANAKIGGGHVEPCPAGSLPTCMDLVNGKPPAIKFAFGAGLGLNYHVNDMLVLRPVDVSYVRAAVGSFVLGNHLQFATMLGLRF